MIIKKEDYNEALRPDTFLLSFDMDGENYYFINFKTLLDLKSFIAEKGLLNLYNQW